MSSFLSFIDIISPKITLYYKGQTKHSSLPSQIISIITILALTVLSVIFSLDFFLKKNPTCFYYNRYIDDTGVFPLNSSSMFHFISFENYNWDPKAFSMIGVGVSENKYITTKDNTDFNFWIYEKCTHDDIGDKAKYLDNYTIFQNALCVKKFYNATTHKVSYYTDKDFKYPTLEHGASHPGEVFYGLYIQRCVPTKTSIFNVSECYNETYSDSLMINSSMYSIYFIDQYINVEDYHNPLAYFYHKINNRLSDTSYTKNVLNFHASQIKTRDGFIFEKLSYTDSYVYDTNEKVVHERKEENNNVEIYGAFYFSMQNMLNVYDRKYKMLQDVVASIGGIIKLVSIVAFFINYLFYKNTIFNDLRNDMKIKYNKISTTFESSKLLKRLSFSPNTINNLETKNNILQNNYIEKKNYEKINDDSQDQIKDKNYNNIIEQIDISKNKSNKVMKKNNIISNKTINVKTFGYFTQLSYLICCHKDSNDNPVNALLEFKKKIISEEQIFKYHFLFKSLKHAFNSNVEDNNEFYQFFLKEKNTTEIKINK